MEILGLILLAIFVGITLIATLAVINLLLPLRVEQIRQKLELSIGKSFLVGLINLVFWLLVAVLFVVWNQANGGAQVLVVLMVVVMLILFIAAIIVPGLPALSAVAQLLGMRMGESKSPLQSFLRGGLVLVLACLTPYIGWFIVTPAILCTAIGAGLLVLIQRKPVHIPGKETQTS